MSSAFTPTFPPTSSEAAHLALIKELQEELRKVKKSMNDMIIAQSPDSVFTIDTSEKQRIQAPEEDREFRNICRRLVEERFKAIVEKEENELYTYQSVDPHSKKVIISQKHTHLDETLFLEQCQPLLAKIFKKRPELRFRGGALFKAMKFLVRGHRKNRNCTSKKNPTKLIRQLFTPVRPTKRKLFRNSVQRKRILKRRKNAAKAGQLRRKNSAKAGQLGCKNSDKAKAGQLRHQNGAKAKAGVKARAGVSKSTLVGG